MISQDRTQYGFANISVEQQGFEGLSHVYYNRSEQQMQDAAVARGEGCFGRGGTFLVSTGEHTGRSAKDKFVVQTAGVIDDIWWDNNTPMSPESFDLLYRDVKAHMRGKQYEVQDLCAGADPEYRQNIRTITELTWHGLFIRHLLRRPDAKDLETFAPDYTLVNCPSFFADPERHGCRSKTVIALNFERKLVLICGTEYAGENKKSVFTLLNYLLPERDVFPMHCSANHAADNDDDVAIFFGLSGTGKTTLSADTSRVLIGDDEHGWSERGVFNIEGGCYAKTIGLDPKAEPEIYATCSMPHTVIENMVYDPNTLELDFDDSSLTANMRCAYPLPAISNASKTSQAGVPKHVVMLTCDAFGVLPPISRLTPEQAMYHFLSGFTSKVAGTEKGVTEPEPTFSTCFGAPFMPRRPETYGALLQRKLSQSGAQCWLLNTGWSGGGNGVGARMPLKVTRALLGAALVGDLNAVEMRKDPNFGFDVPVSCASIERVDAGLVDPYLNPRATWQDPQAYDEKAKVLVKMFEKNFEQYVPFVSPEIKDIALSA